MRTLTVKQNSGGNWGAGWHELTVSTAKYGDYNGSNFLELGFKDYPENFTLRIYAKKGKDGEEFAIGNVFRYANAGITEVLDSCKRLWEEGFKFNLLIAGNVDSGNRSSLTTNELRELQSKSHIKFLGHVDDMRTIYETSDLVVLPSWREGLSRALIEAAAMERPIITTDVPGCRDVVEHGCTGLLVPLRDHQSLTLAIRLLIQNPDLAFKFGKAAREKVLNEFQVSLVNERTLEQYERLLKQPLQRDAK